MSLKQGFKSKAIVKRAFDEVTKNTPTIVKKTARKKRAVRARKQKIAIALSKARAAGASIPRPSSGRKY